MERLQRAEKVENVRSVDVRARLKVARKVEEKEVWHESDLTRTNWT